MKITGMHILIGLLVLLLILAGFVTCMASLSGGFS